MAERSPGLPLRPHPSVYGAFGFLATAMTLMGSVLFYSFAVARWSVDAQRTYWGVVVALLVVLGGLTAWFMRRAPKTRL